jgi:putative transposase
VLSDKKPAALEAVVTARRDKAAALKLLKRIMKKYGAPRSIVTDGLRAYSAAMKDIGVAAEPRPHRCNDAATADIIVWPAP